MDFKCTNKKCGKEFQPHRFIVIRHPSHARCPKCGAKGLRTESGKEHFKQVHAAINASNRTDR